MIKLIVVPYDSGRRSYRMGRGPEFLLASGLIEQLKREGVAATVTTIETAGGPLDSAFDSARQVAAATRDAVQNQAIPVILAGNCITTLGGFAGIDSRAALLWFDAHADFNTPETSPSGFLDGMALAIITGRCYQQKSAAIPGFEPVPEEELVLVGTRSIDDGERPIVDRIPVAHNAADTRTAIARMRREQLYLHVDLDVLDPSALRANQFATAGGLDIGILHGCLTEAARRKRIVAIAITAYDPAVDVANAAPRIVLEILRTVLLRPGY
jgi:arginase